MTNSGSSRRSEADDLPVDSDVDGFAGDVPMHRARPLHTMKRYLLLVGLGGVFGTAARYEVGVLVPAIGAWPLPTLIVNFTGALLLGVLLEGLSRRGDDVGRRRILRLLVGTGFLGSFTTYSTLAVESMLLVNDDDLLTAGLYLAASVIGGTLFSFAGIWISALQHRSATWKADQSPEDDGIERGGTC